MTEIDGSFHADTYHQMLKKNMVQSNTTKKEKLQCNKMRKWMINTISEIAVLVCTLNRMIDGENTKYRQSFKSRKYWSDCTLVHETDAPGL